LPAIRLIAGLGNPGPRYSGTRHNAGFLVLDELARRHALSFRKGKQADEAKHGSVLLIKPLTFMNLSGSAVQAYSTKNGISPSQILVVHDDLDLPLGRLRFRQGGSAGGQRGVTDTINRIGQDFLRLKVGIGRPPQGWKVENWVLSRFRDDEQALLGSVIHTSANAIEVLLQEGLEPAMNRFNGIDLGEAATRGQAQNEDRTEGD
jgi:PTH1 family peptidyl-tRNA hydrolase